MKMLFCAVLFIISSAFAIDGQSPPRTHGRKLIIAHNWDMLRATTEDVWRNRAKFGATGFDGVLFPLDRQMSAGKIALGRTVLSSSCYQDSEFDRSVELARECLNEKGLSGSLAIFMMIPPRRLAWSDNVAWAQATSNIACFARAAKRAGFRGFAMDHEDYTKQRQFIYQCALDGDIDETSRMARLRGRQFFGAFYRECPEALLLSFWLFSDMRWILRSERADYALKVSGNLWIPFLNGLLDVLPSTARIVEGNETTGYAADGDGDLFRRLAHEVTHDVLPLLATENQSKYKNQLSVSFGQYLDAYVVPPDNKYHIGELGGTRLRRFCRNVTEAARASDDLVWVYGEKGTLIDWDVKRHKWMEFPSWSSQFRNLPDVLRAAAGDVGHFRRRKLDGTLEALPLTDGVFHGATFTNAETKVVSVSGTVCPGDITYVCLKLKGSNPSFTVSWEKAGQKQNLDTGWLVPDAMADHTTWQVMDGVFVVPEGADGLSLLLGAPWARNAPVSVSDISVYILRNFAL